jgi:hypothetical protein
LSTASKNNHLIEIVVVIQVVVERNDIELVQVPLVYQVGPNAKQNIEQSDDDHSRVNDGVLEEGRVRKHVLKVNSRREDDKAACKRGQMGRYAMRFV